ncbi:MAG: hypothetical protein Q8P18_31520 [Pseudomonadota bacterium]|nr:hypothetical protein [Pseudomonadota bacterium]
MTRAIIFLAFLAGCPEGSGVTTTTTTDEGTACLNDAGEIQVTFPGCLSSSCDTLTSATCTAELVDGVLVVHGESIVDSEGDVCTDDCGIIQATCAAPLIEDPSSVMLSYAGVETPLDAECAEF